MATTKSTRLTNRENSGLKPDSSLVKGKIYSSFDTEVLATAELDAADIILYDIYVPSNAIHEGVFIYNDDLDSSTGLVLDVGLFAKEAFTSTTSSADTKHAAQAVLDADLLVDGSTVLQAATTDWTRQTPDSATFGPEDAGKRYWELLGYDSDPRTEFQVALTISAAATTAVAGDCAVRVDYYDV